jgi:hypothetical protein
MVVKERREKIQKHMLEEIMITLFLNLKNNNKSIDLKTSTHSTCYERTCRL